MAARPSTWRTREYSSAAYSDIRCTQVAGVGVRTRHDSCAGLSVASRAVRRTGLVNFVRAINGREITVSRKVATKRRPQSVKPPIRWAGVVFAFATNLLFTTGADLLAARLPFGLSSEVLATMIAPLVAGFLTALYTRERGGMHALLGGMLSVPVLALFTFGQNWQFALLSGAFCTLGGALTEIALRRRPV